MPDIFTHNNRALAYQRQSGAIPGLMFLGGYASDMAGTKAQFLAERCAATSRAFLRFDYSGHGQSEGRFRDGCIGDWFSDALAIFDACTEGGQILIGSSMGGWLALKLALARPERVRAVIGVAAAPDFTEDLVWDLLSEADKARMAQEGYLRGQGDDPLIYTHKLVVEGRNHLLLRAPLPLACPLHLLQGQRDTSVPWQITERIRSAVTDAPVSVTLIPDGDHRLSREPDMQLLWRIVTDAL